MTFEELLRYLVEKLAENNCLFDSYSYNNYIAKMSEEDKKKHITINFIVGKDYIEKDRLPKEDTKLVYDIDDNMFKRIRVYYSANVKDNYKYVCFDDDRIDGTHIYDNYITYVPEMN